MSAFDKMRLELPNGGGAFETSDDLRVTDTTETQFAFNGANRTLALFEQFVAEDGGPANSGNGLKQSVALGSGAGLHQIEIAFNVGPNTGTWGDAQASDDPQVKLQALSNALNTTRIDSDQPATLELFEYSSAGRYDPLDVAILDSQLSFDSRERQSTFDGAITVVEVASLDEISQSLRRTG